MNILVIAYPYISLYKDIQEEIVRQDHQVTFFEDKRLPHDVRCHRSPLRRLIMGGIWERTITDYWTRCIKEQECLSKKYDLLFVLSGYSIHKIIIDHLRTINPDIRTVYYTWDPCNYYAFEEFLPLFDKAYTFDLVDCQKDSRWRFLPIYHKVYDHPDLTQKKFDYQISFIGTNHDKRYSIVKAIIPQLKRNGWSYYIRIIDTLTNVPLVKRLRLFFRLLPAHEIDELSLRLGRENADLLSRKYIVDKEYNDITDRSLCILDTARATQSGLTARFIWALAAGKKIITTNRYAMSYGFVNDKQVYVLNDDFRIPLEFLSDPLTEAELCPVDAYRIDNWVKEILS